ncbi:MAG: 50S ribosomal protein L6 [Candidatus Bathyarchaeia archaeon]
MVRADVEERFTAIPQGVDVALEGKSLRVKGPLGEITRDFSHAPVEIVAADGGVYVRSYWARKTERALVGTVAAHVKNMINGVTKGYTYKLKVVFSHFPVTIKVNPGKVLIENFIGEKSPRTARIIGNAKVTVKGDDVIVQGVNLEEVSQTAANIERATKIKKKDPRVFLDGIYIYERGEGAGGEG